MKLLIIGGILYLLYQHGQPQPAPAVAATNMNSNQGSVLQQPADYAVDPESGNVWAGVVAGAGGSYDARAAAQTVFGPLSLPPVVGGDGHLAVNWDAQYFGMSLPSHTPMSVL